MRRSIRSQVLVPLVIIQVIAVLGIASITAMLAAQRGERQITDHLDQMIATLNHASFPFTTGVLAQMHGLSGAHFVRYRDDDASVATTLEFPGRLPAELRALPLSRRLGALGRAPTVLVGSERYFAVRLRGEPGRSGMTLIVLYPEASWRQARWDAAMPPLTVGFAALGLMVAVTSWLAHRISRRLQGLQTHVSRIASGDFLEIDPGTIPDEVRDLTRSINAMSIQLRGLTRTIRQSERSLLLAQLAAGLAHQLRNALTGSRLSIQLHARRCPGRANDRSLDVAVRQLAMTEAQIKGLLSMGRVEQRRASACDIEALLDEIAHLVHPTCEHARVTLTRCCGRGSDGAAPRVWADPPGIQAALLNLVLNAIEAAGANGAVRISVNADDDMTDVDVEDNGPGPPPELQESLFEPFITSKPEGVGLGLALARQVANEHGGRLSVSRVAGMTRFRLRLPNARPESGRNPNATIES